MPWSASKTWKTTRNLMSDSATVATAGSSVYSLTIPRRSTQIVTTATDAVATAMRMPVNAARRARSASPAPQRLGRRGRGGEREREGDLVDDPRDVRHDLVPAHHARAEARDQQGHEAERRDLEGIREPDG